MKWGQFFAVLIVSILVNWAPAYGDKDKHARNMDGADWICFSRAEKMGFVLGFSAIQDIFMRRARETNDFIDYVLPETCTKLIRYWAQALCFKPLPGLSPIEPLRTKGRYICTNDLCPVLDNCERYGIRGVCEAQKVVQEVVSFYNEQRKHGRLGRCPLSVGRMP